MFKTITATYDSETTLTNVVDDLINDGLPREKIYSDDTTMQVKVMVPETGVPGIKELLNRHNPPRSLDRRGPTRVRATCLPARRSGGK